MPPPPSRCSFARPRLKLTTVLMMEAQKGKVDLV